MALVEGLSLAISGAELDLVAAAEVIAFPLNCTCRSVETLIIGTVIDVVVVGVPSGIQTTLWTGRNPFDTLAPRPVRNRLSLTTRFNSPLCRFVGLA